MFLQRRCNSSLSLLKNRSVGNIRIGLTNVVPRLEAAPRLRFELAKPQINRLTQFYELFFGHHFLELWCGVTRVRVCEMIIGDCNKHRIYLWRDRGIRVSVA